MNSIIITAIIAVAVIIVAAIVYKTIDNNSETAFNNAIMNYKANDKETANQKSIDYAALQSEYHQYKINHEGDSIKLDNIRRRCADKISTITAASNQKYSKSDFIKLLTEIVKMS